MHNSNHDKPPNTLPVATRKTLLQAIYDQWEAAASAQCFACRRGCADCCTQSVTATALEAELIRDHFAQSDVPAQLDALIAAAGNDRLAIKAGPLPTTNEFVRQHLSGTPPAEDNTDAGAWDFTPCPFLHGQACSIYPVRPFGCRAFASTVACGKSGQAVVPPVYPAMMTVVMQLIEHLDAGRPWGNFLDLLAARGENRSHTFSVSRRLPGFLLNDNERPEIETMLALLVGRQVAGKTIGEWLDAV